jgi:rubrerythrin
VQLLAGKGFKDVYNMKGGINAWNGLEASGPVEIGESELRGDESPEEIIILAYGMEEGLSLFYKRLTESIDDREIKDLLVILSSFEDIHKKKLFSQYNILNNGISDEKEFRNSIVSDVMEGGITVEEFFNQNSSVIKNTSGLLNIAMMLEAQALDLYLRYSHKFKDENVKNVLDTIADEEKAHLKALGKLLENNPV